MAFVAIRVIIRSGVLGVPTDLGHVVRISVLHCEQDYWYMLLRAGMFVSNRIFHQKVEKIHVYEEGFCRRVAATFSQLSIFSSLPVRVMTGSRHFRAG